MAVAALASPAAAQETRHPVPGLIVRPFGPTSSIHLDAAPRPERFPELVRHLEGGGPSVTVGVIEGPRHQMFGKIESVAVTADGRVAVLDARFSELRVDGAGGRFVDAAGGSGRGPGEFTEPISLAVHRSGRIYVGDLSRSIHVFELEADSLRYAKTIKLPVAPADLCLFGDSLVVHGVSLEVQELLHVVDPDGKHVRSFGRVYDAENRLVNDQVSRGEIACLPEEDRIVFTPGGLIPELRAYTLAGDPAWITAVEGYRPIVVTERSGEGVEVTVPEEGFHRVESLSGAPGGSVVYQVAHVTHEDGEGGVPPTVDRLLTYGLDGASGEGALLGDELPLIGAVGAGVTVSVVPGPVPKITIATTPGGGT